MLPVPFSGPKKKAHHHLDVGCGEVMAQGIPPKTKAVKQVRMVPGRTLPTSIRVWRVGEITVFGR